MHSYKWKTKKCKKVTWNEYNSRAVVATIRLELVVGVVVIVVDPEYPQGQVLRHLPEEPDP